MTKQLVGGVCNGETLAVQLFKDRLLPYTTVRKLPRAAAVADEKTLDARVDAIIAQQPQAPVDRGRGRLGL